MLLATGLGGLPMPSSQLPELCPQSKDSCSAALQRREQTITFKVRARTNRSKLSMAYMLCRLMRGGEKKPELRVQPEK